MNKAQEVALFDLAALAQEWETHKEKILTDFHRFTQFMTRFELLRSKTIVRDVAHEDGWRNDGLAFFLTYGCAQNINRHDYGHELSDEESETEYEVLVALDTFLDQGHLICESIAYMWGGYHKEHKVVWRCMNCPDEPSLIPSVTDIVVGAWSGGHWHSWRYPPSHKVDRKTRKKIRSSMLKSGYNPKDVESFYRRLAD